VSNHFNESSLADLIVRVMDITYASGIIPIPDNLGWNIPYQELALKRVLYKMFGVGDICFLQLKATCESRGYPIGHALGMLFSTESFVEDLIDKKETKI
jgi:hypothetical protein